MPQKLKAIFFDVGNTLLFPNRTKILAPLYERKISPSAELLRALECRAKIEFDAIGDRGGRFAGSARREHANFSQLVRYSPGHEGDSATLGQTVSHRRDFQCRWPNRIRAETLRHCGLLSDHHGFGPVWM